MPCRICSQPTSAMDVRLWLTPTFCSRVQETLFRSLTPATTRFPHPTVPAKLLPLVAVLLERQLQQPEAILPPLQWPPHRLPPVQLLPQAEFLLPSPWVCLPPWVWTHLPQLPLPLPPKPPRARAAPLHLPLRPATVAQRLLDLPAVMRATMSALTAPPTWFALAACGLACLLLLVRAAAVTEPTSKLWLPRASSPRGVGLCAGPGAACLSSAKHPGGLLKYSSSHWSLDSLTGLYPSL